MTLFVFCLIEFITHFINGLKQRLADRARSLVFSLSCIFTFGRNEFVETLRLLNILKLLDRTGFLPFIPGNLIRFFINSVLPVSKGKMDAILAGDTAAMDISEAAFG